MKKYGKIIFAIIFLILGIIIGIIIGLNISKGNNEKSVSKSDSVKQINESNMSFDDKIKEKSKLLDDMNNEKNDLEAKIIDLEGQMTLLKNEIDTDLSSKQSQDKEKMLENGKDSEEDDFVKDDVNLNTDENDDDDDTTEEE